nr:ABC transporter ATP-binding protein [Shewanella jiangmenensis]
MSTLSIQDLHSDYRGVTVLSGLSLTLAQGEIVALLGPSGCGKTTLLRSIAGLQGISRGSVAISGQLVNDASSGVFTAPEKRGIGMIFQDYALFPHLSVADNILFGVKGLNAKERAARLDDMLALVKLPGLAKRYPHELSGGQQQRVSIARALAYEPQLLLLDEPFSNIDAQVRRALMLEIRAILKARNVSAVFVTHSKDEAFAFADTLALFEDGRIVQHGIPETLYQRPKTAYVADFLGASNYLAVTATPLDAGYRIESAIGSYPFAGLTEAPSRGRWLLRPEHLLLEEDAGGEGIILERRFLGNGCHYLVQLGEQVLDIHSHLGHLGCGARVRVTADVDEPVLFA